MKIFRLCMPNLLKQRWQLVFYILITLGIGGISIFSPYLTGNFIDTLVSGKGMESVYRFCVLFAVITVIRLIASYVTSIMYIKMQVQMGYELNKEVVFHVQELSLSFINNNNTAYLNQTINTDANTLIIFCITFIQNVLINIFILVTTLYICFKMNFAISCMFIAFVAIYILLYLFSSKILYRINLLLKESQGRFFSSLQEQLQHVRFVKIHSFQKEFRQRLETSYQYLFSTALKNQRISYLVSSADGIVSMIAQLLLFLVGSLYIMKGTFTIGMFTIFSAYFNMMLSSARYFFNLGKTYQDNLVSYNRLINIINQPKEKQGDVLLEQLETIQTNHLYFAYNEKTVLHNISLHFEKGKIYGLVGTNGSGKSTLVNLLAGLYVDEKEGNICYNNIDIHNINLYQFRKNHVGISEQEPTLINDTIKYNLLQSESHIDSKLLNKYIEILNLDNYLSSQQNGLYTYINESNNNLSGGEKQKISILRVLLKNPDIMIFDEPTSALDSKSAQQFMSYLNLIKKDKIIIVITHHYEIQNICDMVYTLSEGWISTEPPMKRQKNILEQGSATL